MQVNVNKPSTVYFKLLEPSVRVFKLYDAKGQLYFFRYLDGKTPRIKVNIPDVGTYDAQTPYEVVKVTEIEIPSSLPRLPPAERSRFKNVEVIHNPDLQGTPARIFSDLGKIETGDKFYKYIPAVRLFLLLHEMGHMFYVTEEHCDLYAMVNFLRMGYNRSTAFYALSEVLRRSRQNIDRVSKMFNNIQSTQKTNLI